MAPFSARATTRKTPKNTREPPFHTTGCPVARPDRDNRGRQSVDGDAVDNNGNAVTSEDVLSGTTPVGKRTLSQGRHRR